jgi:hypothetical protein
MMAVKAHVSGDRSWRDVLKQQIASKQRKPARTNYSLEDFRIVVSMKVPDLTTYYLELDDGNLSDCGVNRDQLVSIVSPISMPVSAPNARPTGGFVLDEPSITLDFISDSMLNNANSPFGKYLSPDQLGRLKDQKSKAIAESKEEEKNASTHPQLDALLKMIDDFVPGYPVWGDVYGDIKQVIDMDLVDVSFLHSMTGKTAFVGTIRCECKDLGSLDFLDYDGFSPDSFRGNPFVRLYLDGEYVVEGNDVVIKITARAYIQEWPEHDNDPESLSKKDLCLLFESMLKD